VKTGDAMEKMVCRPLSLGRACIGEILSERKLASETARKVGMDPEVPVTTEGLGGR